METSTLFWGHSGSPYQYFESYPPWSRVPANYLFATRLTGLVRWYICYAGQTKDASDRFPDHEKWRIAVQRYGATHILTHVSSPLLALREAEERDLIRALDPPLNVQHRIGILGTRVEAQAAGALGLVRAGRRGIG